MKRNLSLAATALLTILAACQANPPAKGTQQPSIDIPRPTQTETVASSEPVASVEPTSEVNGETPTATLKITATLSAASLATYTGVSVYPDSPLFEVAYDPQRWSIELDPSMGSLEKPAHKLINAQIPACTLFLREGAREYLGFGSAVLGGRTWRIDIYPPDRLIYSILYENGGFLFAVGLPPGGTDAQRNDCKEQAETVLATFEVLR